MDTQPALMPDEILICDLTIEDRVKKSIFVRFLAFGIIIAVISIVQTSLIFGILIVVIVIACMGYISFIKLPKVRLTLTNKRIIGSYYATILLKDFKSAIEIKNLREVKAMHLSSLIYGPNLTFMLVLSKESPPLPARRSLATIASYANKNAKTSMLFFYFTKDQMTKFFASLNDSRVNFKPPKNSISANQEQPIDPDV